MSSSELSELSSSPLTDDDEIPQSIPKGKLEHYFKVGASALPPKLKKKRAPSPPHEYVLADNPDIAVSGEALECLSIEDYAFLKS